jgi:hypothetical protein
VGAGEPLGRFVRWKRPVQGIRAEGLEPRPTVLETGCILLNQAVCCRCALDRAPGCLLLPRVLRSPVHETVGGSARCTGCRVEGNGLPYIRLIVRNRRGRRTTRNARVFVAQYAQNGVAGSDTTMGSPDLGWTSVFDAKGVVLSGGERPIDLDSPEPRYRIPAGSPERLQDQARARSQGGPARSYDVHVNWDRVPATSRARHVALRRGRLRRAC